MNKAVKIILAILVVIVAGYFGLSTWTKSHSPQTVSSIQQNGIEVEVSYSSPYVKGREIFGSLVPYDKVWRTGANEATVISFNKDVFINGKRLAEGEYSLWTIPNPETWTIIFNEATGQWGTSYDESQDILRIKTAPSATPNLIEQLSISFAGTDSLINMNIAWENTLINVPIK